MKQFLSTKKILSSCIVGAIVAVCVITGVAASATPTPPPVQGKQLNLVISADTVTGGGNPSPAKTCAQTNYFRQGQLAVFRVWGVDVRTGGYALTPKNVASAVVNIPGEKALKLAWVQEPYNQPVSKQVSYWEVPWSISKTYPLGVVNFTIVFKTIKTKTHPSYTGTYSQKGFSSESQLQVTT